MHPSLCQFVAAVNLLSHPELVTQCSRTCSKRASYQQSSCTSGCSHVANKVAGVLLVLFVLVDVVSQNGSGRDDVTHDFIFFHIYAQLKCLV